MSKHANLNKAKKDKKDEFYTRYEDIEKEVMHYRNQFENKVVLCNCDDPVESNFWQFFHRNFSSFKLKKLISTHYVEEGSSYAMIYDGTRDNIEPLTRNEKIDNNEQMDLFQICTIKSNGDFRSPECIKYLEEADIVVTNPPFSLWHEFVRTIIKYNKKFLVLGTVNAAQNNYIIENKMWAGYDFNSTHIFKVPDEYEYDEEITNKINDGNKYGHVSGIAWYTNLNVTKRNEELVLYKEYNEADYPRYDNYNAIEVNKTNNIPCNYFGYMGVPITFISKYNPEQFEILGYAWPYKNCYDPLANIRISCENDIHGDAQINGKRLWIRLIIRRKYDNENHLVSEYYDDNGNLIK